MDILWTIFCLLIGACVGALILALFFIKAIQAYKKQAKLYLDMYLEAAETIKDLVVYNEDIDDLK